MHARPVARVSRSAVTPGLWLAIGLCATLFVYAVAGVGAAGLARRARESARVPRSAVTGRAEAALGDSAVFAMPGPLPGVRLVIPLADAESAAVAMGYRDAPSYWIYRGGEMLEKPIERRRLCGRSFYVRPVVALPPASVSDSSVTNDIVFTWGPAWVVPVCDGGGAARTTVILADAPTRLRVVLGDQPGDIPRLVYPRNDYSRIGAWSAKLSPDLDRGIGLAPEVAVAVAAARLAGTGARIAEVPDAFAVVIPPRRPPQGSIMDQSSPQMRACMRWRLTLDRSVTLRGIASGQVVRTRTVYAARGDNGCGGAVTLQIPRSVQPATLPFWYGVRPGFPRDTVLQPRNGRPVKFPDPQMRSVALRVTEPVWFEEAAVRYEGDRPSP